MFNFLGTNQVKDIKPGVLSKIFIYADKKPEDMPDESMK